MNIKDFEGTFKYKLIMPSVYILSWISMIAGPLFFPLAYQTFIVGCICYLAYKFTWFTFALIYIHIKAHGIRKRSRLIEKGARPELLGAEDIMFGFIIPSYKEDIEMLAETLDVLAAHRRAK